MRLRGLGRADAEVLDDFVSCLPRSEGRAERYAPSDEEQDRAREVHHLNVSWHPFLRPWIGFPRVVGSHDVIVSPADTGNRASHPTPTPTGPHDHVPTRSGRQESSHDEANPRGVLAYLIAATTISGLDVILDDPKLSGAWVAAQVTTLDGTTVYQRNADRRMMPASNQKLLSNTFAFAKLGSAHRFQTRFWKVPEGIRVDAGGDPMLTFAQLTQAGKELGIKRDTAVYVRQAFTPRWGPSWEWDDLPNKYAAPVSVLTVDRGSFEIWAENGKAFFEPRAFGTLIVSIPGPGAATVEYQPTRRVAIVRGTLPKVRTRLDTLALPAPDRAAVEALGGTYARADAVPERAPDLVIVSPPLSEIAKECLERSDNNLAEQLLLAAAAVQGPLGDDPYATASARLTAFLEGSVGASKGDFSPEDGSGLSRHNQVTARGLARLLVWSRKQSWGQVFEASLATPGVGTLNTRLLGSTFHGKTGTLHLASALSGYVKDRSGRLLAMSLVINHYGCSASEARKLQDRFVTEIESSSPEGTLFAPSAQHESARSHPQPSRPARGGLRGHVHHLVAAHEWADVRTQPDHALLPRSKRVAVPGD